MIYYVTVLRCRCNGIVMYLITRTLLYIIIIIYHYNKVLLCSAHAVYAS
eukprot:COSAG06_NODE_2642_length_6517_cov_33.378778_6_plen_49_part_00